jgi:hypothetical protein
VQEMQLSQDEVAKLQASIFAKLAVQDEIDLVTICVHVFKATMIVLILGLSAWLAAGYWWGTTAGYLEMVIFPVAVAYVQMMFWFLLHHFYCQWLARRQVIQTINSYIAHS